MTYHDDLTDFEEKVVDLAKFLIAADPAARVQVTAEVQRRVQAVQRAMGEQLDDAVYAFVRDWKWPDYYPNPNNDSDNAERKRHAIEAAQRLIDRGVSNHSPIREIQDRPARTAPSVVTVMAYYDRGEKRAKEQERRARWEAQHAAQEDAERTRQTAEANDALVEAPGWSIFDTETGHRIGAATVEQVEAFEYVTGARTPRSTTEFSYHTLPYLERIAATAIVRSDMINGFPIPKPTDEIPILIRISAGTTGMRDLPDPQQPVGRVTQIGWHYEWDQVRRGRKLVTRPINPQVFNYERAVYVRPNELETS